jgi:thiamine-phosphate pyrophosphorylase
MKSTAAMVLEAKEIAKLCKPKKALFLVNDRVDVALGAGAGGVHIGQGDMPLPAARKILGKKKIIGVTVHNAAEAVLAKKGGADYVSVSPIFATATKSDAGAPCGVELIKEIKKKVRLPVVAIGGINESNLREVLGAGADSVAVVSAIVCAPNPGDAAKRIISKIGGLK